MNITCDNLMDLKDMEGACVALLAEGLVIQCSYTNKDLKQDRKGMYVSKQGRGLGQCQDWKPKVEEVEK